MSSCSSGKEGYSTHQLAEQAMYHIRSLAKKGQPTPIRVYYCHECERFHLSSQPKDIKDFLSEIFRRLL